jgi:hypothetical protein
VPILRLPSGAALRGFEEDAGDLIDIATGSVLAIKTEDFVITLDVADKIKLPTKPARSK